MTLPPVRQLAVAAALLLATACTQAAPSQRVAAPVGASADSPAAPVSRGVIEVHRSRTCQCCHRHEEHLRQVGFEVVTVFEDDIMAYKAAEGIPSQLSSCHTSQVAGYFVEGHVPAEAIIELLEGRPEIDGIALPGMPGIAPAWPPTVAATAAATVTTCWSAASTAPRSRPSAATDARLAPLERPASAAGTAG